MNRRKIFQVPVREFIGRIGVVFDQPYTFEPASPIPGAPAGAVSEGIFYDSHSDRIGVVMSHDSFPPVAPGGEIPWMEIPSIERPLDLGAFSRDQLLSLKEQILTALFDLDHPPLGRY